MSKPTVIYFLGDTLSEIGEDLLFMDTDNEITDVKRKLGSDEEE